MDIWVIYNLGMLYLKLNIQKTKIMASGPITSWQIDGGNNGNSERLYFWGGRCSKITAHGDYSHEIKRHMLEKL